MNTIYVTDGSFEGLLTAIHTMYYTNDTVTDILREHPLQLDFTNTYKQIETDINKANNVYEAIKNKISRRATYEITMAWLSELPLCGYHIANYIKLGFKVGKNVDSMISHNDVLPVLKASRKVAREEHRMLGLCRFSKTAQGYYLCIITPDLTILTLIAPHFAARMSDKLWIIADMGRDLAAVYDCEKWMIISSRLSDKIPYSKDEIECRKMWKKYFNTIAIAGRRNPKLQRNMMPARYWKNLTEFIDTTK
jgi:probable DNA metabolism protein